MGGSRTAEKYKHELAGLAEGLPFKKITVPEFRRASHTPMQVRQTRTYHTPERGMQAIGRFLIERGTVEILSQDQTLSLFREIHWCAYQIRRLARKHYKDTRAMHKGLVEARRFISEIEAAEEELFIANRRLVVSCVKPFFWIGPIWLADFLQEGAKALSNAVRKFDFTRGTPFYAYAQKAIQNRLRNYFRDHIRSGSIGIRPTREMVAIKTAMDKWKEEHEGEPDDAVIAKMSSLPEERVKKVRPFVHQWEHIPAPPLSLDAMVGDSTANLYQFVENGDSEEASHAAQRSEIWAAIDRLPPRARHIMRLRFLEGRTLEETGQMLDLTRARIKQIQDDALRKLRQMLRRGVEHPRM
ncbi:MAG: sigma-70 family RNA polymerase sigma factor [Kiritimatiellae bacterium]|nr:sigma-70 family RNA polymerase sigma factor [Kiritimatiellia bacterium]